MDPQGPVEELVNAENLDVDSRSFPSIQDIEFLDGQFLETWSSTLFDLRSPSRFPEISDSGNAGPQVLKRRRGKTYTGCLTCRERKIKCDERRPVCLNCARSRRYSCRGYIEASTSLDSESAEAVQPPTKIRAIDGQSRDGIAQIPARSQQSCPPDRVDEGRATPRDTIQSKTLPGNQGGSIQQQHPEALEREDDDESVSSAGTADNEEGLLQRGPSISFHPDADEPAIVPCLPPGDDLLDHYRDTVSHFMMPTIDSVRNPWLRLYLPMALHETPTASQLALRHALMSVAAHHRAQREESVSQRDTGRAVYHEREAVRILTGIVSQGATNHAPLEKCASLAAAMSLISIDVFSLTSVDCNFHLNLAKRIVQVTGGDRFWKSNLLSGILYQIFRCYDMVAATTQARSCSPGDERSPSSPDIATTCLDSIEIACLSENDGSQAADGITDDEFSYTNNYILDTSFGIGLQTVSLLHQTIKIGASYGTSSVRPVHVTRAIEALSNQLYRVEEQPSLLGAKNSDHVWNSMVTQWTLPQSEAPHPGSPLPKVISDELIKNHQWAFHYAVILYFHRIIPGSLPADPARKPGETSHPLNNRQSDHSTPARPNHQLLVGKVLDRLETIDCLTRDTHIRPANTLWPAFIAAVEAVEVDLRHRALIWFSRAARKGIGNIVRAKALVMEVWRRVDRQICDNESMLDQTGRLGPIDWRIVMEEMGHCIMLT